MRKGINKPAFHHALDVVRNCFLADIKGTARTAKLYKTALLHDVLEDGDYTPEKLKEIVRTVGEDEIELLKLLSRNIQNDDGSGYIEGIMNNEDAVIVKFADRISNIKDLILWVNKSEGFTENSLATTEKYLHETKEMLDTVKDKYPNLYQDESKRAILKQVIILEWLYDDLKELYEIYGRSVKEGSHNNLNKGNR